MPFMLFLFKFKASPRFLGGAFDFLDLKASVWIDGFCLIWRFRCEQLTYTTTSSANQLFSGRFDGFVAVNLLHRHFIGKSTCFGKNWRFRCGELTSPPLLRQISLFLKNLTLSWRSTHFTATSSASQGKSACFWRIWRFRDGELTSPPLLRQISSFLADLTVKLRATHFTSTSPPSPGKSSLFLTNLTLSLRWT